MRGRYLRNLREAEGALGSSAESLVGAMKCFSMTSCGNPVSGFIGFRAQGLGDLWGFLWALTVEAGNYAE